MAVLTKDNANMFVVKPGKSREFIEEVNRNVVGEEFWKKCEEMTKCFRKRKIR